MKLIRNIILFHAALAVFMHAVVVHVHDHEEHHHSELSSVLDLISHGLENSHQDGYLEEFIISTSSIQIEEQVIIDLPCILVLMEHAFLIEELKSDVEAIQEISSPSEYFRNLLPQRGPPVA